MIFRSRARPRTDVPTSSMADIAFLLLIFFLVTTVFTEEKGLQIVLPEPGVVDIPEGNIVFFHVRADGVVELQRGNSPQIQLLRSEAIPALWRAELQRNPDLYGGMRLYWSQRCRGAVARMQQMLDAVHAEADSVRAPVQ